MERQELPPTPYSHKAPMRFKNYDIFFNQDHSLTQIVPNRHNYYEFYFLLSGDVTFFVENIEYHLTKGDIILISPDQLHCAKINPAIPYKRYVLWLSVSYVESLSSESTRLANIFHTSRALGQQIRLSNELLPEIHQLFRNILIHSHAQKYGSDLLANAYITELLVLLAQTTLFAGDSTLPYDPTGSSVHFSLVLRVLKYVDEHIHETIHINEICEHCFVSRSYLSKIFSRSLGMPVYQYIIKKKLYRAKQDIQNGIPAQEVTVKYSFGNYSTFYNAFRKEFGQSPRQIKRETVEHS